MNSSLAEVFAWQLELIPQVTFDVNWIWKQPLAGGMPPDPEDAKCSHTV